MKNSPHSTGRTQLLGLEFDVATLDDSVASILAAANARKGGWISTVNVAILMMMRSDSFLDSYVRSSMAVVADGQPLVWLSCALGNCLPERVSGVDLVEDLCARAADHGMSIFILGGAPDTSQRASARLRKRYPSLDLAVQDGYFDSTSSERVADQIRSSGARIVFVGMGVPRQEEFISRYLQPERYGIVAVGVGGTVDVVAGMRKRAPRLLQQIGAEWLFRLAQEPRRLWRRYFNTGWQFLIAASVAILQYHSRQIRASNTHMRK